MGKENLLPPLDDDRKRQIDGVYRTFYEAQKMRAKGMGLDFALAEDAVQDFYLHWLEMPKDSPHQPADDKVKQWTNRSIRFSALAHLRNRTSREANELKYGKRRPDPNVKTPLDEAADADNRQFMASIINGMATDRMICVYHLMRLTDWTAAEMAEQLNVNEKTIQNCKAKIRAIFLQRLGDNDYSVD